MRSDDDVLALLQRRETASSVMSPGQEPIRPPKTPSRPNAEGVGLRAPSPDYLALTRKLRNSWLARDALAVQAGLHAVASDTERVFGPFNVPDTTPFTVTLETHGTRPHLCVQGLPREVNGALPVLLAPNALREVTGLPDKTLPGWIRGDTAVSNGTVRFPVGTLRRDALSDLRVLLDPAPSPTDFPHIGLAATSTLRQGPTSTFARMVRELAPYLMRHTPHLYVVEGAYRAILTCGLLRKFPSDHLHCLPPGRLGALVDMGAAVAGQPVAALDATLGDAAARITELLDLCWTLDCVVYLIDPLAPTSTMPETIALERECAHRERPFLDTYASVVDWFQLLDNISQGAAVSLPGASRGLDATRLCRSFPYQTLALLAHDDQKDVMTSFVQKYFEFLSGFQARIGSGGTAAVLNRALASEAMTTKARSVTVPWVQELQPGPSGGNLQIGESLAMGLCDAALCFGDPRRSIEPGVNTNLFERTARIGNDRDRLSTELMLLHDATSAAVWALMWLEMDGRAAPVTLMTAFAELFDVDLVLSEPRADATSTERWALIADEAAWFLASAIGANRTRSNMPEEPKRVTVACGSAVRSIVACITESASPLLNKRIAEERRRQDAALSNAVREFPHLRRRITRMAARKRLTLRTTPDLSALWSVGPIVVAPLVGALGPAATDFEAIANARALATTFSGEVIDLPTGAFERTSEADPTPAALTRHWASTDIVVMTCADLAPALFGGAVRVRDDMYVEIMDQAVGEIAGLYVDKSGNEVLADTFVRRGMPYDEIRAVAASHDNRTAILAVGAAEPTVGWPERVTTTLSAIRGGLVSVLVTDEEFATAVLRKYVADSAEETTGASVPLSRHELR